MTTKVFAVAFIILQLSWTGIYGQPSRPKYLEIEKKFRCVTCPIYTADLPKMKRYEIGVINNAFKTIMDSKLEFGYPQGGCQNRGHVMSMLLRTKPKLEHGKVWVFAPIDLDAQSSLVLEVDDKNKLSDGNVIKWNYHVAPFLLTEKGGKTDTLVIDPSLFPDGPVQISQWLLSMRGADNGMFALLQPEWYFPYLNGTVLTGEFYKFEVDDKYCADNYRNLTLEKSLSMNDLAVYIFKKYLLNLQQSTNIQDKNKFGELRKVFGNVAVLSSFFDQQSSYCGASREQNLSLRKYQHEFTDIMTDALLFYSQRLAHWIPVVKDLEK